MPFAIGAMRHRLVLQTPVETPDLAGGVVRGWSTVVTLWGSIEPLSEGPGIVGEAPSSLSRLRVVLRWRGDVAAGQRLVKGSRIFAIRAVSDPDERRLWLVLTVEETTA